MKVYFFIVFSALILLSGSKPVFAQDSSEQQLLTELLHWFMDGASRNDRQVHDRFWADDLIYTSSAGLRFGKVQIMSGFEVSQQLQEVAPAITYTAHDIQINVYHDVAVVAFQMKGETLNTEGSSIAWYLNSGTFLKRNNEWRVVNWQATRVPE
jgi:hypothetical protein